MFVIIGTSRIQPVAFVDFTTKELKKFKVCFAPKNIKMCTKHLHIKMVERQLFLVCAFQKPSAVVLEKLDPVGWSMKVEVHSSNSIINGEYGYVCIRSHL